MLWVVLSMTEAIPKLTFVCLSKHQLDIINCSLKWSLHAIYNFKGHPISKVCCLNKEERRKKIIFHKDFYIQHNITADNEECLLGKNCSRLLRRLLDCFRENISDSRSKESKWWGCYTIFLGDCEEWMKIWACLRLSIKNVHEKKKSWSFRAKRRNNNWVIEGRFQQILRISKQDLM